MAESTPSQKARHRGVYGSKGLNEKQARFAEEYAVDLNATQAAIRSGYSPATAGQIGFALLKNVQVRARVAELRAEQSEAAGIDALWVRQKLRENVERALQAEPVLDSKGQPTGEYVYQGNVANKALELLGKDKGMFSDKVEHVGPGGGPMIHRVERVIVDPAKGDAG